jgi:hypothetical protein
LNYSIYINTAIRTMTSGKVEIGAFRTYPENYNPPGETNVED